MSNDKMREEFSKWLLDVHGLESEWQPERNCFKDYPAHLAFQSWKSSRAAIEVELPYRVGCGDFGAVPSDFGEYIGYEDVKEEIESLGLKVKSC